MTKRLKISKLPCLNKPFAWYGIDETHIIKGDGIEGYKTYTVILGEDDYAMPNLPEIFDGSYQNCTIWDGGYAIIINVPSSN